MANATCSSMYALTCLEALQNTDEKSACTIEAQSCTAIHASLTEASRERVCAKARELHTQDIIGVAECRSEM